jgi:hypothetical protein
MKLSQIKAKAGKGQKNVAVKQHEEEEVNTKGMDVVDKMNAMTFECQKDFRKTFDKETREEIKQFLLKWRMSCGWKKPAQMMGGADWTKKKGHKEE